MSAPFAEFLTKIVSVPESAVEDGYETGVPRVFLLFGKSSVDNAVDSLVVATDNGVDIFRTSGAAFNLQNSDASLHQFVHKADCLQVFRAHYVLVVNLEFNIALSVFYDISSTANLHARTSVCAAVHVVQTEIALARDCHAQCSVAEHLDANKLALRSADILFDNLIVNLANLLQVEFARKNNYIGKLCIELKCLDVRDVQLGRKMNLLTNLVAISHHCYIRCDYSRNFGLLCSINNLTHEHKILTVDNSINSQITLQSIILTNLSHLFQVVNRESAGRMRSHVQVFYTKINRICSCFYCRC